MPIYEYRCDNGHTFEAFQAMSDASLDVCEVCDAPAARVLSAPAVHFKGSGFYTTDYARKGAQKAAANGGEAKSDSKSESGSSKSDSDSGTKKSSEGSGAGSGSAAKSGSGASAD